MIGVYLLFAKSSIAQRWQHLFCCAPGSRSELCVRETPTAVTMLPCSSLSSRLVDIRPVLVVARLGRRPRLATDPLDGPHSAYRLQLRITRSEQNDCSKTYIVK